MSRLFLSKKENPSEEEIEELRMVWAEVYAPNRPDSGDDFATEEDIRQMAYNFIRSGRMASIDVQHDNVLVPGACIVESFIAREGDPVFIPGSWVVGMHIDNDDVWAQVKAGELNGFSMEALAHVEEVTVEIEIPPVVSGTTSETDGHTHRFYVTFDEDGNFRGGKTDTVDGHFHQILAGTHTEDAKDHSHRFSSVDDMEIVSDL